MNMKFLLLLVLGFSFLFFGCTQRTSGGGPAELGKLEEVPGGEESSPVEVLPGSEQVSEEEPPEVSEEESPEANETEEAPANPEEELAGLFNISTEQPLGDEGLDTDSPSSD